MNGILDQAGHSTKSDGAETSRWKYFVLIVLAIAVVYGQALRFDFVTYDDYELVYQNGEFLSHINNVVASFTTHVFTTHREESGYYRPLLLVSYILDYHLWGLKPLGYHLTNVLIHSLTAVLLFIVLEFLTHGATTALIGSLLFALHPVQVESVAWIAGRNDILLGLFIIIMIMTYSRFLVRADSQRRIAYVPAMAFGFALFTKESAVFYLLLLPLLDLALGRKSIHSLFSKRYMLQMLPFGILVAAYLLVRMKILGGMIGGEKLYGAIPFSDRISLVPAIVSEHLKLLIVPAGYSVVHPTDQLIWMRQPFTTIAWILPLVLIVAIWLSWSRKKMCSVGCIWLGVGLLPVLGIFPVAVPILEHRLYLPMAGIGLAVSALVPPASSTSNRQRALIAVWTALVLLMGCLSFIRLPVWQNSETMWLDAIEKAPSATRSYYNLAGYYFERQQYDRTIDLMKKYVELKPDALLGYSKLRQALFLTGRYVEAARVNRILILRSPFNSKSYFDAATMWEQLNQLDSAASVYEEGLRADSNFFDLHLHLGLVLERQAKFSDAEKHLKRAVDIHPDHLPSLVGLGTFYARRHEDRKAIGYLEEALKLGPPQNEVLSLLLGLYEKTAQHTRGEELIRRFGIQSP